MILLEDDLVSSKKPRVIKSNVDLKQIDSLNENAANDSALHASKQTVQSENLDRSSSLSKFNLFKRKKRTSSRNSS
jgi:hypothetical protein